MKGRAALEEDKDGKVLCEQIVSFEEASNGANPFRRQYGGNGGNYGAAYKEVPASAQRKAGIENTKSSGKLPTGVWVQFVDKDSYQAAEKTLLEAIADSDGSDHVVVYIKNPRSVKVLPSNLCVKADAQLVERLFSIFGKENVKIVT